jgi:hypothetical protein
MVSFQLPTLPCLIDFGSPKEAIASFPIFPAFSYVIPVLILIPE